jgi:hypothetical protein
MRTSKMSYNGDNRSNISNGEKIGNSELNRILNRNQGNNSKFLLLDKKHMKLLKDPKNM